MNTIIHLHVLSKSSYLNVQLKESHMLSGFSFLGRSCRNKEVIIKLK